MFFSKIKFLEFFDAVGDENQCEKREQQVIKIENSEKMDR